MGMMVRDSERMARKLVLARQALGKLEREFSEDTLKRTGLVIGSIMRDPETGNRYRVESAHAYQGNSHGPRIMIQGRRIYSTGRSDAATTSYLDLGRLEPVGPDLLLRIGA